MNSPVKFAWIENVNDGWRTKKNPGRIFPMQWHGLSYVICSLLKANHGERKVSFIQITTKTRLLLKNIDTRYMRSSLISFTLPVDFLYQMQVKSHRRFTEPQELHWSGISPLQNVNIFYFCFINFILQSFMSTYIYLQVIFKFEA